jgi:hypothetical protein
MTTYAYACCDCGTGTVVFGLEAIPDPPRCLGCHFIALLEQDDVREWLGRLRRAQARHQRGDAAATLPRLVLVPPAA